MRWAFFGIASFGGFPGGSEVKASACNAGEPGSIPGSGRSPGEGNYNPLQNSCLENPMKEGTLWATVHRVAKSWTRLSYFTSLLWIGMKTDIFQSYGHCWVFQICWHIECSTFTASSFRIWNSSTGILSPPLALFVVMLPKVHLTSHSWMCGSRWVITPFRLSGSCRFFWIVLLCILATSS